MKLVWASDIHLNFINGTGIDRNARELFYADILNRNPDCVVISGDIAESHNVVELLQEVELSVGAPLYFVLGNHDFYRSSVKAVKESVKHMGYIPNMGVIPLSASTALVGVDAWGDCRNGDYENNTMTMSDWLYIEELNAAYLKGPAKLKKALQKLADADAQLLAKRVTKAVAGGFKRIIIVTHVPPFENACLNSGRKSTPSGLCFFSSRILGETIEPIAREHSEVDFLWLCGHTHSRVTLHVRENLEVRVAGAEYYYPQVNGVIEYD